MSKESIGNYSFELCIYFLLIICLCFSILIQISLNNFSDYRYSNTYNRSWEKSYISDIKVVLPNEQCPLNFEKVQIGAWSGFGEGCICSNQIDSIKEGIPNDISFYIQDKLSCEQIPKKVKEIYQTCIEIPYIRPFPLFTYKGVDICAKYEKTNYYSIAKSFNQELSKSIDINKVEFSKYSEKLNSVDIKSFISNDAIIDLKFINTTLIKNFSNSTYIQEIYDLNLRDYEITKIKYDLIMIVKRLKNEKDTPNNKGLKLIKKLIIDIHLSNDIWCSYLDISIPFEKFIVKDAPEFGYRYCNDFYNFDLNGKPIDQRHYLISYFKELFFNDNYYKTSNVIFDQFETSNLNTKYDFYNSNQGITKIYNTLFYKILHNEKFQISDIDDPKITKFFFRNKIDIHTYSPIINDGSYGPDFKPVLMYENFLDGIGCYKYVDPKEHYNKIKKFSLNMINSKGLFLFCFINIMLLLLNSFVKFGNWRTVNLIIYGILILFQIICLSFSLLTTITLREFYKYIIDYNFYCQNDKTNFTKIPFEVKLTQVVPSISIFSSIISFLVFVSITFSIIQFRKISDTQNSSKKEDSSPQKVIQFQHKIISQDISDVKSKISVSDINGSFTRKDGDIASINL